MNTQPTTPEPDQAEADVATHPSDHRFTLIRAAQALAQRIEKRSDGTAKVEANRKVVPFVDTVKWSQNDEHPRPDTAHNNEPIRMVVQSAPGVPSYGGYKSPPLPSSVFQTKSGKVMVRDLSRSYHKPDIKLTNTQQAYAYLASFTVDDLVTLLRILAERHEELATYSRTNLNPVSRLLLRHSSK